MVMNHLVVYCTANDIPLPAIDQYLIYDAFNFCPRKGFSSIKNEHLRHVVKETKDVFPNPSDGDVALRGALIGHLVVQYMANIKSSIVGKWYSVIKNSINTHLKIYHSELDRKEQKNMFNKIYKRITQPQPDESDDEYLDEAALELLQFHRTGFGVENDGWVNDIFIENKLKTSKGITHLIQYFSQCLQLQCTSETVFFDGENCLRKQTALPEFCIGRKSIQIDQKGLYYVVKQYMSDTGKGNQFIVPGGANGFRVQLFVNWLKKLFNIGEHLDLKGIRNSNKKFKWDGVVITTDGVKASLHYRVSNSNDNSVIDRSVKASVVVGENGELIFL
jgi:hypothetical protein